MFERPKVADVRLFRADEIASIYRMPADKLCLGQLLVFRPDQIASIYRMPPEKLGALDDGSVRTAVGGAE